MSLLWALLAEERPPHELARIHQRYEAYRRACQRGEVELGRMFVFKASYQRAQPATWQSGTATMRQGRASPS